MKIKHIANIRSAQDGAIFGDFLFRFEVDGKGFVYSLAEIDLESEEAVDLPAICELALDKREKIAPHGNAVVFGNEYFEEGDEFPLLYSNIYNNYAKEENKLCGVCCVYRVQREGERFFTTLVQLVEIGFTDDRELWRSSGEVADVRPYGNFVIDCERSKYYAFVMRDGERTTRYFCFDLPRLSDGDWDDELGVRRVVLSAEDIVEFFDAPYHNFVQGAVLHKGKIYEVEGFHKDIRPAIRVIDTEKKEQTLFFDFYEAGYIHEPELIDFYKGRCIYGDAHGNLFLLELEK